MQDLPQCIHPIMTDNGVGISVMSLPQAKLEPGNGTAPALMEEITITEGKEEITITAEITNTAESTSAEETTETESAYGCCAVATTVQPALRASDPSLCPKDMHGVDGLTLNMALLNGAKTNVHVCCDAKTKAEDVDTTLVQACANEATAENNEAESEEKTAEKDDNEEKDNTSNTAALSEEDGSNSANSAGSAAFAIGALCVLIQTVL